MYYKLLHVTLLLNLLHRGYNNISKVFEVITYNCVVHEEYGHCAVQVGWEYMGEVLGKGDRVVFMYGWKRKLSRFLLMWLYDV